MQHDPKSIPIIVDRSDDGIARICINRPEHRNALSLDTLEELRRAFDALRADSGLKYAVLTGAGDRCFAAGGDLKELGAYRSREEAALVSNTGFAALDAIRQCTVPVYAALNGHALGGGAELAMACDFRIANAEATIGFLQGKLNITTAWGGSADLLSLVGPNQGFELLLGGRTLTMTEAKEYRLIDQIVPQDLNILECVAQHAGQFFSRPAIVIHAFTQVIRAHKRNLRAAIRPIEFNAFVNTWVDESHWSAVQQSQRFAIASKQKP